MAYFKVPSRTPIPFVLVAKYLNKIDERLVNLLPDFTGRDITDIYLELYRWERSKLKRALVMLRQKQEETDKYFYQIDYEDQTHYGLIIEWSDVMYLFNRPTCIRTQMMSESLEGKLKEATRNAITKAYQNIIYSSLSIIQTIQFEQNSARHFTINNKGEMTFTPAHVPTVLNDEGRWKIDGRMNIKIGKGIRKILSYAPIPIPDKYIEQLNNELTSQYKFNGRFEMVFGRDIPRYYHEDQYAPNSASLKNSCMKYDKCQKYFSVYEENPDVVRMLVAFDPWNRVIGRALVWKTISHGPVMDRIYGKDLTINAFKQYAQEKQWMYKQFQSHTSQMCFMKPIDGQYKEWRGRIEIMLQTNEFFDYWPYMDTFQYMSEDSMSILNNEDGDYRFTSTEGGHEDDGDYVTLANGEREHRDYARYCDYVGEWYHEDDVEWCEDDDGYYHVDDVIYVGDMPYYQDSEHIGICEVTGERRHYDDLVCTEDGDYVMDQYACTTHNGEVHLIDDCTEHLIDGIHIRATETFEQKVYACQKLRQHDDIHIHAREVGITFYALNDTEDIDITKETLLNFYHEALDKVLSEVGIPNNTAS